MDKKVLFVIDMQNDFIDGSLGSDEACKIVPNVVNLIKNWKDNFIFYTLDTHYNNYMQTLEGRKLPVEHCIKLTDGWNLNKDIKKAIDEYPNQFVKRFEKNTFGSLEMIRHAGLYIWENVNSNDEIYICGLCTDICVLSNALLLRAQFPNLKIVCYSDCCAGTSKEAHEAALMVMRSNQIDVESYNIPF